jgi:hypothetical protein
MNKNIIHAPAVATDVVHAGGVRYPLRNRIASNICASIAEGNAFAILAVHEHVNTQEVSSVTPDQEQNISEPVNLTTAMLRQIDYEPSSRKLMKLCFNVNRWEEAEQDELNSIRQCEVWHKHALPSNVKVLPLKWVYRVKKDLNGNIIRYKARLVAQGFFQVFGQDYTDTYSPVARFTSVRMILALGAQLGLTIHQMDVDTAFLNAPITEDIWVKVPEGTKLPEGDDGVYKLLKSLYGLKQAPREWNNMINDYLISQGFERLEADPCIYRKEVTTTVNNVETKQYIFITLYVDDLIISASTKSLIRELKKSLCLKFKMKDLGVIKQILGMGVLHDRINHKIYLSQSQYIKQLLKEYSRYNIKSYNTPMDNRTHYCKDMCPKSGSQDQQKMSLLPYRELIGALLWICNGSRPDIAYAVTTLAKFYLN